jgi:fructokinase
MSIGIDLGGSKIEGVIMDAQGGELVRRRAPTPSGDYDATIAAVAGLVRGMEENLEAAGAPVPVGVGIPGAVSSATGLIKNANSTCLIGRALGRDLEQAIGRPVRLANDANCFTISEAVDGAGKGSDVVFGVILGTGVGGGVVVGDRLFTGVNAIAGEWGHNPLPWPRDDERPGAECYCGLKGCIETFVSGPALARDHRQSGGDDIAAIEIAARAKKGDEQAVRALDRYSERLARALASVINLLDPDVIVLGGGLSNIEMLYERVPELWRRWIFSDEILTRLAPNHHGDSSGVRGAAWLWTGAE